MLHSYALGHFQGYHEPTQAKATLSQPLGCAQVILVKYPPEDRKLQRYHLRAIYVLFIRVWAVKFTPP